MDDRFPPEFPDVGANAVGVIARIRDEGVAFGVYQKFFGHRGLVLLPGVSATWSGLPPSL
ncbi:hypothetical protein [Myxococcus xanthus]|uniref:Uncharacterized protein n=1 Tax=Myxococcus xanthus TaxID=34 RepID=A0A7Y4IGZ2_MYXXA|nr:hypothetical protein [Myxococcus xanthus]NOJ78876.1 hypothetical protein [Myxococcus xanthus]NOJ85687.1 hypothetical protein [Myxococcus xanthus]